MTLSTIFYQPTVRRTGRRKKKTINNAMVFIYENLKSTCFSISAKSQNQNFLYSSFTWRNSNEWSSYLFFCFVIIPWILISCFWTLLVLKRVHVKHTHSHIRMLSIQYWNITWKKNVTNENIPKFSPFAT